MSARYPFWPRMMKRSTAAAYCDLSSTGFEREVNSGTLPLPVKLDDEDHWSRDQLDAALDRLLGHKVKSDWRKDAGLAA